MKPAKKAFKWTLLRLSLAALAAWGALLLIFAHGRICVPLGSRECVAQAWDFVGNVVWLVDIDKWQTLATGVLAILAAGIGAWFINRQTQQADAHERERWRRRANSERAMTPLTLSGLTRYLELCAAELKRLLDLPPPALRAAVPTAVFPAAPLDLAAALQRMIEASSEEAGKPFMVILSHLQILDARLQSLTDPARMGMRGTVEDYVLYVAELHAWVSLTFPYARFQTEDLPTVTTIADHLKTSLNLLAFDDAAYPTIYSAAEERSERFKSQSPASRHLT